MSRGSHHVHPTSMKEGTKILKLHHGQEVYIPIEYLQKGDLIKTGHGYKVIMLIGKIVVHHSGNQERTKDCLYLLTKKNYPALFEDLIVSGCQPILVPKITQSHINKISELGLSIHSSEDKYDLPAYADERAIPYEKAGTYTMYHFALQNVGDRTCGCYANGLFVATANTHWLHMISKMTLIE